MTPTPRMSRTDIAARIARPCLMSPTALPKAMTEATGISRIVQI